jgi:3D (Asp-Asp-Asp) domain-containing protein/peptidoglycan hydrolase CwlO-like protein
VRASCHKRSARLATFSLAVIIALLATTGALADDPAALRNDASTLRSANASLATRSQQALLELYSLQSRLGQAEQRIAALEDRRAEVQRDRASAKKRLQLARSDFQTAERQLAARLRQLYVEGEVDPLAVLLGAESLDEALSALDGLDRLATQDKAIVGQLAHAKLALRTATERLAARQQELDGLIGEARATRAALARAQSERASYLGSLRRQQAFNSAQISRLTDQAAAAEAQAETLVSSGSSGGGGGGSQPPGPPPTSGTKMTVSATGYCLKGTTATGVPVSWGVISVDPSVIPLGTKMFVPGYGEGVAADTGSAVKGNTIDLWFPSCAQASAWGRRTVTITIH